MGLLWHIPQVTGSPYYREVLRKAQGQIGLGVVSISRTGAKGVRTAPTLGMNERPNPMRSPYLSASSNAVSRV